jgi:V/A-type H+-transporting ATPase subunit C
MPASYRDTDYMYSSARLRALEAKMLGREGCERLLMAGSTDEMLGLLAEFGYRPSKKQESERVDREATLFSALSDAFAEVVGILPQPHIVKIFQYKYDCNNIKAAIKARARGVDPRDMMLPLGTLDPGVVTRAVEAGDFSALPEHMAKAAGEAADAYLKTKNPQKIDIILDRACFADMLDAAKASGVPFVIRYVKVKIDLTNILMCIRLLRMHAGNTGRGLFEDTIIDGGELDREFLLGLYDRGEARLADTLAATSYSAFAAAIPAGSSISHIEREADKFIMNMVREVRWLPFGAEIAAAYLIAHEYGLMNVRIIMAGKEAGLAEGAIRERMREMYV